MLIEQEDKYISLGRNYIENYSGNGSSSQPYKVLRRIFKYAEGHEYSDHQTQEIVFSWQDIQDESDLNDDGRKLKKNLKIAEEKWRLHSEDLNQRAYEEGLSHFPVIERLQTGGGAGNVTKYRIRKTPIQVDKVVETTSLPRGYIRYNVEVSDRTNRSIRIVDGLVAKGAKLYAVIGAMLLGIILGGITIWAGLVTLMFQESTFGLLKTILFTTVFTGLIYSFFSPVYFAITRRIIIAPTKLSPKDKYSSQVEYTPTGELHKDGKPVRQFRIVTYVSECPICGGRIDVEQSSWSTRSRLIGVCTHSPREHIYSFDHQTRIGKLLHEEYLELI